MAIRYSGDVEIRMSYSRGWYQATIRAPGYRGRATLRTPSRLMKAPQTPQAYDLMAQAFLRMARKNGARLPTGQSVERVWKSPCPTGG